MRTWKNNNRSHENVWLLSLALWQKAFFLWLAGSGRNQLKRNCRLGLGAKEAKCHLKRQSREVLQPRVLACLPFLPPHPPPHRSSFSCTLDVYLQVDIKMCPSWSSLAWSMGFHPGSPVYPGLCSLSPRSSAQRGTGQLLRELVEFFKEKMVLKCLPELL